MSISLSYYLSPARNIVRLKKFIRNFRELNLAHFFMLQEIEAMGPIQRDEAILLSGVLRVTRPLMSVEFGFMDGHSSKIFLKAIDKKARLISYDITDRAELNSKKLHKYTNFKFLKKSQTDFAPADLDNNPIDFVFLDAAHDLALNQKTFQKIIPHLAPGAVIAVHDTGAWDINIVKLPMQISYMNDRKEWLLKEEGQFLHQKEEREFVNWILKSYPEFSMIHFHSLRTIRHGLTLIQKTHSLKV